MSGQLQDTRCLLEEIACECEPSESTCARCAAIEDTRVAERRIATLEAERRELVEALETCDGTQCASAEWRTKSRTLLARLGREGQ
jgi:hypothetical protein